MLLALTQHPTYRSTMKHVLPWLGMGLCLAALAAHLAWDIVGWRTSAAVAQAAIQKAQTPLSQQIAAANPLVHVWQTALVRSIRLHATGWNGARFARSHFRRPTR